MPETTPAGAMPAAEGATPSQSQPDPVEDEPAKGAPDELGDGGKRALEAERVARKASDARAKAAEAELEKLRTASLSETEKAIAEAKKAGADEATTRLDAKVRRAEVRAALTAAGINPKLLDLVARADEFDSLPVTEEGDVEGLRSAVTEYRRANPDMFGPAVPSGDIGQRGGGGTTFTREQIERMTPAEHAKNRDAIFAWLGTQKR